MFFFAIIRFRASANISLNLLLNIYLFWLLHLSQKNLLYLSSWFFLFSIASSIKFWFLQLILFLKEYVFCVMLFLILILQKIADRLTYSNTSFWWSFVLISALYIYRILSWQVPITINIFPNSWEDWAKVIFYFPKFYNLLIKRATGGLLNYYGIVHKEENKIIRKSSSQ